MTELKPPIGEILEDGFEESDVARVWRKLDERTRQREGQRRTARGAVYALSFAAAAAALSFFVFRGSDDTQALPPLFLADGRLPVSFLAHQAESLTFSDGSRVSLAARSRLEVLHNEQGTFLTSLRSGSGVFEVKPGGKRRWLVDCGVGAVEVVGTRFALSCGSEELKLSVEQGAVMVRGASIPGGTKQVSAGQSFELGGSEPSERAESSPKVVERSVAAVVPEDAGSDAGRAGHEKLMHSKASGSAGAALVDALLARADTARRTGDTAEQARLLERAYREAGNGPRAAVAGFALAKLKMSSSPAEAARLLRVLLDKGVPASLEEDVMARLVEAHVRAGNGAQARAAAQRYEERYPHGAHLSRVKHWLEQ